MTAADPIAELDTRFSDPNAVVTSWADAQRAIEEAELFWIATVRVDGRPHVTPLPAVWQDGALHFCTGAAEQKGGNLARNPQCTSGPLTTSVSKLLLNPASAARPDGDGAAFRNVTKYVSPAATANGFAANVRRSSAAVRTNVVTSKPSSASSAASSLCSRTARFPVASNTTFPLLMYVQTSS